jgi:hypothetical protein
MLTPSLRNKLLLLPLFLPLLLSAQTDEQDVMNTIDDLFLAMEMNDSILASSLFTSDAKLFTVYEGANGITQLRSQSYTRLTSAFASVKEITWHEPIWNERIQVADGLASVWVDYAFYIGNQLSHCGVDAFHLVKIGNQWKIFHLADTRRKNDCKIPEHIKAQYEK